MEWQQAPPARIRAIGTIGAVYCVRMVTYKKGQAGGRSQPRDASQPFPAEGRPIHATPFVVNGCLHQAYRNGQRCARVPAYREGGARRGSLAAAGKSPQLPEWELQGKDGCRMPHVEARGAESERWETRNEIRVRNAEDRSRKSESAVLRSPATRDVSAFILALSWVHSGLVLGLSWLGSTRFLASKTAEDWLVSLCTTCEEQSRTKTAGYAPPARGREAGNDARCNNGNAPRGVRRIGG